MTRLHTDSRQQQLLLNDGSLTELLAPTVRYMGKAVVQGSGPGKPIIGKLPVLLVIGMVIALYFWTAWSNGNDFSLAGQKYDYYNLLANGFRDGHLYLKVQPDPRLRVEPPNRVVSKDAAYLLDVSYYRGRYFLYFGVTPALLLFYPYALLTGQNLPEALVAALVASVAFLLNIAWLTVLRRRFFPRLQNGTWTWIVAAVGLCNALPVVIRKPEVYEIAVISGYACTMASLLCLTLSLTRSERALRWLAMAGVCAGLAIGSRPSLSISAAASLVLAAAMLWWRQRKAHDRALTSTLQIIGAAVLPFGACLAGLGWYNWARFGNPFEFGWRYQLGSNLNGVSITFSNLWYNLGRYYLTPPDIGWFFPFFAPGPEGYFPQGYYGIEQAHGQFLFLPLLGFSLVTGGWIAISRRAWPKDIGTVVLITGVWFAASLVPVAMIGVRSNRYMLDFHPLLLILTLLPVLACVEMSAGLARWLARGALGWLAVLAVYNVFISFQVHGFFQTDNPWLYARLERACNRLVWPLHRLTRPALGSLAFQVVFPAGRPGRLEPLLLAGSDGNSDAIYVHYLEGQRGELIFAHQGYGEAAGIPFDLHPDESRQLEVSLGTIMPPSGHPWYDGMPALAERLRTSVRAMLDGAEVLSVDAACHQASPDQVVLGRRRGLMAGEATFGGKISFLRALGADRAWLAKQAAAVGPVRLRLQLPRDRFGVREPLWLSGTREQFDFVYITYVDEHSIQFGIEHRGNPNLLNSSVMAVDYLQPHEIIIEKDSLSLGEWQTEAEYREGKPEGVRLWLDGYEAFAARIPLYPAEPWQMYVGCMPWPLNTSRRMFGGRMLEVSRLGATRAQIEALLVSKKPLSLHLLFPKDRVGIREPLLTTGVTGHGDGLYVHYIDRDTVAIGFDHWGVGGPESPPLHVDYSTLQQITISFGPLLAADDPGYGRLYVAINGMKVFDMPVKFHPARPKETAVGRNPIGLSTSEAVFQGRILSIEPAPNGPK